MNLVETLAAVLAGAVGAVAADVLRDNSLALPRLRSGRIYLGSVGTLCLGAVAGGVASLMTAAPLAAMAAGFCCRRWLPSLMSRLTPGGLAPSRKEKGAGEALPAAPMPRSARPQRPEADRGKTADRMAAREPEPARRGRWVLKVTK